MIVYHDWTQTHWYSLAKENYDSKEIRAQLCSKFQEKFANDPHEWQLDVTEALLLRTDSIIIAGTGSGKTIPFMLHPMLHPMKMVLIVSPLKVLQKDQVSLTTF